MAADKEYVELKRKLGVCVACGCQDISVTSTWYCDDCLEKMADKKREKFYAMTPEEKEEFYSRRNEKRRSDYQKKKEKGICVECNKPAYNGTTLCGDHLLYKRRWYKEKRNANKVNDIGLCRICGSERMPGKKLCPEHYEQARANMLRNRRSGNDMWRKSNDSMVRKSIEMGKKNAKQQHE